MTIAEDLGHFVAALERETIPKEVWQKAHTCILNGYGIAMAGLATPYEPVARKAAQAMYPGGGKASLLGSGETSNITGAVMANGALFHGRGQEDTCGAAHLGAVVIPLLMALIESGHGKMEDLIPALIAGYEVGGLFEELLAGDTTPKGFRATTLYGVGAAAAATARLFHMEPERICAALGNAVSFSGGLLQTFAEGTDEWRYQVGITAQAGWAATELARGGSVSIREAYEGAKGLAMAFAGGPLDTGAVTAKIGRDWQTLRVAFKPFPVCAFNQTPVTSAVALRERIGGREITDATVRMNPYECGYAGMDSKGPFSTIGGTLMSIPFCIALTLLRGAPSMAMMTEYDNAEINALVERVNLEADPKVPTLCCRMVLQLADGEVIDETCTMTAADYAYEFEDLHQRLVHTNGQENVAAACVDALATFAAAPVDVGLAPVLEAFATARGQITR
ncbi:MmgE/PrpD family protein [Aquicoccus sp. G2-2]|uniref:MmgE/PrpD family protein n=1 Tax=Aquicoccus sp. G2-2 TaxID=3092120 RepID=UPI002ADFB6C4|nr:MmgE/PrpD family protein [Aquicoccus sp. G2-2]MEA1114876.1 MmgE/PrpD family protein [Aquicoccus sp. G2-2]